MERSNRIFGLDLMRAVAIIMVLIGHCAWIYPDGSSVVSSVLALSSFMGVEVFFVLSGFLIGRILYRQYMAEDFTVKSVMYFLRRRWFRTLPNYFLVLVINVGVALLVASPITELWKYFFFIQNFASPMLPFFTESWSLSVEEFAYIILPLSLLSIAVLAKPKNKNMFFVMVTLFLVLLFIVAKMVYTTNTNNTSIEQWNLAVKSVVIYRLDSIFIGVLAGWIYINYESFWERSKHFWAFLGCVMMGFFAFGVGWFQLLIDTYPIFWNVVYLPLVSVSIAFFLPVLSGWKSAGSALSKPIVFISLISYSIYLLHYSVILQTLKYLVNTNYFSVAYSFVFTVFYLFITILLSYFLYRFYEKPMTNRRD